ncbi:TetR/AcrR family transcriptional regulator [Solihabitans fulvus]|uniref:TetR/AcrR family transcriptional regulator n=1 Tax=Solihabitans fulvus TaxID=1892852 RepID=A0A5B2WWW1_9PSEU|nr:TetR family transcriptional regulator [Solihabitans fulvus]KAA2254437.1 TetR/AcrR family transcriptional regulator [Solihabitans fulvus]
MGHTPANDKPRRTRDPEAHRAAILDAARACFTERGYARGTIRDIASRAGVTHGLVMRHFSSKEQLFVAAMPGPRDLADVVAGDPATLPERLALAFVERLDGAGGSDPLIALIRSTASNEEAATALYREMRQRSADAYRAVLDGLDVDVRIELLIAHLIGVTFSRHVIGVGPLAELPADRLVAQLARSVRQILFDQDVAPGSQAAGQDSGR